MVSFSKEIFTEYVASYEIEMKLGKDINDNMLLLFRVVVSYWMKAL